MGVDGISAEGARRIERTVARHVDAGAAPGAVWLVARGDTCTWRAAGDPRSRAPCRIDPDAIFRISSMTKPVTAARSCLRRGLPAPPRRPHRPSSSPSSRTAVCSSTSTLPLDGPCPPAADPRARPAHLHRRVRHRPGRARRRAPRRRADRPRARAGPALPPVRRPPDEWMRRLGTLPLSTSPGAVELRHRLRPPRRADRPCRGSAARRPLRDRMLEPLGMHDTGFHVRPTDSTAWSPPTGPTPTPVCSRRSTRPTGPWSAARLPVGRGRARLHRRRPPRLRPDAPRRRTRPRAACSRGPRSS